MILRISNNNNTKTDSSQIAANTTSALQIINNTINNSITNEITSVNNRVDKISSTGLISGGKIEKNTDELTYNISAGTGVIHYDGKVKNVSWDDLLNNPFINNEMNIIYIDTNGEIVNLQTEPTTITRRQYILLGGLYIADNKISEVFNFPMPIYNELQSYRDFLSVFGIFNISGNVFTDVSGLVGLDLLNIYKGAGKIFQTGGNFQNDINNPNIIDNVELTAPSFEYFTQTGGNSFTNLIDPNNYDLNGVLTSVGPNKWQNQRIYLTSNNSIGIEYGQFLYDSLDAAKNAISVENHIPFIPQIGLLRCIVIVKSGTTDLSSSDNEFIDMGKFGTNFMSSGIPNPYPDIFEAIDFRTANIVSVENSINDKLSKTDVIDQGILSNLDIVAGKKITTDIVSSHNDYLTVTGAIKSNNYINISTGDNEITLSTDGSNSFNSNKDYAENITGTKTSVVSGSNTYSAASHEVIGDYVSDINIKDKGLLVYDSTLIGAKTRNACIHSICNSADVPLKAESRTGIGEPYSVEVLPYAGEEIKGAFRMKGRSSNTKCDMIKWDSGSGGIERNLGKLRFNVLDEVENVDEVLLLQASYITTEPSATINSVLNIKNSTAANTITISSLPAGANAIQSSTNLDETITGNKTIVATNITENIGANKVENIAANKVENITANHVLNSNTSAETHTTSKTITAPITTIIGNEEVQGQLQIGAGQGYTVNKANGANGATTIDMPSDYITTTGGDYNYSAEKTNGNPSTRNTNYNITVQNAGVLATTPQFSVSGTDNNIKVNLPVVSNQTTFNDDHLITQLNAKQSYAGRVTETRDPNAGDIYISNTLWTNTTNNKSFISTNPGVWTEFTWNQSLDTTDAPTFAGLTVPHITPVTDNVNIRGDRVSIGTSAAIATAGANSIAIGRDATISGIGARAVSVGYQTSAQGGDSISLGPNSTSSNFTSIAIGAQSSSSGSRAIALGSQANANQSGSIVLNAGSSSLTSPAVNSFTVSPIRNVAERPNMRYNSETGEITYNSNRTLILEDEDVSNQTRSLGRGFLYKKTNDPALYWLSDTGGAEIDLTHQALYDRVAALEQLIRDNSGTTEIRAPVDFTTF